MIDLAIAGRLLESLGMLDIFQLAYVSSTRTPMLGSQRAHTNERIIRNASFRF